VQAPVAIDKGRELPLQTFARPRLSIEWAIRPFAHNLPEFAARQTAVASGWAARVVHRAGAFCTSDLAELVADAVSGFAITHNPKTGCVVRCTQWQDRRTNRSDRGDGFTGQAAGYALEPIQSARRAL
jgi:hypothetical protein